MKTFSTCTRQAVIDVGSNAVKLYVADVGDVMMPVLNLSRQTLLGLGSFRTGRLQPEAIARTVAVVEEFVAEAIELRPTSIRIVATSAAREAANGIDLVEGIFRATRLTAEIISGDQEADYLFQSTINHSEIGRRPRLIVGVGGGSTQWIVAEGEVARSVLSTHLGTSRLLENHMPADPPKRSDLLNFRQVVADLLRREVRPRVLPVIASLTDRQVCLIGSGGGLKSLAKLVSGVLSEDCAPWQLRVEQIRELVGRLWMLSNQERRNLAGINPDKADELLASAVIYEAIMVEFNFAELIRNRHGLGGGLLMACRTKADNFRPSVPPQASVPWLLEPWHEPTTHPMITLTRTQHGDVTNCSRP